MNHDTRTPLPLAHLAAARPRVLSAAQLRAHGISPAQAAARTRPGGTWQTLLPGVYLLHRSAATSEERLHGALLYAGRPAAEPQSGSAPPYGAAMVTGFAALVLHRFASVPPLSALEHIDVLVPAARRLRSTGCARIVRTRETPRPLEITGLPVAPVARALADAVARLTDGDTVRRLLREAVHGGHCEPAAVVAELSRARLLGRPPVASAVDALLAEGRAAAEERLYEMVREHALPDPVWNVDLQVPDGSPLGVVDAYWPDHAVAVELNTLSPRHDEGPGWAEQVRKRERLEELGITVVHLTPRALRESPYQQATVVRTALMAATGHDPGAYVVVLPR
ncbi:hypothetical protein [Streptomyces jumonjinensis]|uniref:hypothetical protein n=1 Tax=Streptomyces jumonjinensis TaxID=1945 RepID=UPI0037B9FE50